MKINSMTSQVLSAVAERISDKETVYLFLVVIYVDDSEPPAWASFFYGYDKAGNISKYQRNEVRIK